MAYSAAHPDGTYPPKIGQSDRKQFNRSRLNLYLSGMHVSNEGEFGPYERQDPTSFKLVRYYPESGEPPAGLRGKVEEWLYRHPFFRRHPHPAVVHFPLGLLMVAALFEFLALATASHRTEWAAYCCLIVGMLSVPVAIMTGYFTWWINYVGLESSLILVKRHLAWVALVLAVFGVLLRSFIIKEPLQIRNFYVLTYVAVLLVLASIISIVGFLGGELTFPY
jgi:uncharacterized membrane protein